MNIQRLSDRWQLAQFPDSTSAIEFAAHSFYELALSSVEQRGRFVVALSGGSTPAAVYSRLAHPPFSQQLPWSQIFLFWSDERSVPPDHVDSNFRMAMDAGLRRLPIPQENIFRMQAESDLEVHAAAYERLLREKAQGICDLILLGIGSDGHTASLFPKTQALSVHDRLVVANHVPQQNSWRMTFTYPCIRAARNVHIYVLGTKKSGILNEVLNAPPHRYPIQEVGTADHPALWITDCSLEVQQIKIKL